MRQLILVMALLICGCGSTDSKPEPCDNVYRVKPMLTHYAWSAAYEGRHAIHLCGELVGTFTSFVEADTVCARLNREASHGQ